MVPKLTRMASAGLKSRRSRFDSWVDHLWTHSSVAERLDDSQEVGGSVPPASTRGERQPVACHPSYERQSAVRLRGPGRREGLASQEAGHDPPIIHVYPTGEGAALIRR